MQKALRLGFDKCGLFRNFGWFFDVALLVVSFFIPFYFNFYEIYLHPQIIEDEEIFAETIYPIFLKDGNSMNAFAGVILGAWLIAFVRVISFRLNRLRLGDYLLLSIPAGWTLLFIIASINTLINAPEINLSLLLFFGLYAAIVYAINIVYVFYSCSFPLGRKSFFIWPNWYCSFVHLLALVFVWYYLIGISCIRI